MIIGLGVSAGLRSNKIADSDNKNVCVINKTCLPCSVQKTRAASACKVEVGVTLKKKTSFVMAQSVTQRIA